MIKKYSVMVLPRHKNHILLQKITKSDGTYFWDGFGSFFEEGEDDLETVQNVFKDNFGILLAKDEFDQIASLNFFIDKPSGFVDLKTTVYFVKTTKYLTDDSNLSWFEVTNVPYENMHESSKKWMPLILENEKYLEARIKVYQPGDHTQGKVTEFTVLNS